MNVVNKIILSVVMSLVPSMLMAHEGMHSSAQMHIGDSHMGLMEVSLAVLVIIAVGIWALKEAKK
ncbi:MAG: hypothetical protein ACI9T9_000887 [Oleiphilaceae bacterium]|jgi:hypothetical protein